MRFACSLAIAAAAVIFVPDVTHAQAQPETARAVAGGGISVTGWTGKIDANEEKAGQTLNNAKLAQRRQRPARHDRPGRDLLESRRTRRPATTR